MLEGVASPGIGIFHRPLAPRQHSQPLGTRLKGGGTGHEIESVLRSLAVLFESGHVVSVEYLSDAGKGQGVGFHRDPAHGAGFDAVVVGFGLD